MFILIRAAVYSSLFIGFLLVFLPAAALLGAATYHGSVTLAGYALAFLMVMEVFVRLYEEPTAAAASREARTTSACFTYFTFRAAWPRISGGRGQIVATLVRQEA